MEQNNNHLINIYQKIKDTPAKYGEFRKTLFHLHTPASHDYRLLQEWDDNKYKSSPDEELIRLCIERKVFPDAFDLSEPGVPKALTSIFKDKKEWLSYCLLAHVLFENQYEWILVSDHNTINGVKKLQRAVNDLYIFHKGFPYPEILPGVEISCADKNHVVVIYNDDKASFEKVTRWLEEHLISEKSGTYETSMAVIDAFQALGCIAYIAHINSSEMFSAGNSLSGAYKKHLSDMNYLKTIGIKNIHEKDVVQRRLANYGTRDCRFVIDNDSHDIDNVKDNYFWIKTGRNKNFQALNEAFIDFDVSVAYEKQPKANKYIEGVCICFEESGFLKAKTSSSEGSDFVVRFSSALNCFIGGRGTGKSTVLDILEFCLSGRVDTEDKLDFICMHGNTYILFKDDEKEYLVEMLLPVKDNPGDNILRYYGQNEANTYRYRYHFEPIEIYDIANRKYLKIYEVSKDGDSLKFSAPKKSKNSILDALYDRKYSVNQLVQTASGTEIDIFIRNLLFKDNTVSLKNDLIHSRSREGLHKDIERFDQKLDTRRAEIEAFLSPFNNSVEGKIQISYSRNGQTDEPPFGQWLTGDNIPSNKRRFLDYPITEENAVQYLLHVYDNLGFVQMIKRMLNNKETGFSIHEFILPKEQHSVSLETESEIIEKIIDTVLAKNNIKDIVKKVNDDIRQQECFSLLFNTSSNAGGNSMTKYIDVKKVSLGQKVVAMLDLILGYGTYIGDKRPILIDQPEDNLDSQYIYNNLVSVLRNIKNERQVIIATHNATIVTNAMADLVCVMKSDGDHGWIDNLGYPSEKVIKKHILNYLEGGAPSFKHKIQIYGLVL